MPAEALRANEAARRLDLLTKKSSSHPSAENPLRDGPWQRPHTQTPSRISPRPPPEAPCSTERSTYAGGGAFDMSNWWRLTLGVGTVEGGGYAPHGEAGRDFHRRFRLPRQQPAMNRKLLLSIVGVLVALGVWIFWQQGGLGGPISEEAARVYFARIVKAAQARDFATLCNLNASQGTCEFDMRIACRSPEGGPLDPGKKRLLEWCRAAAPVQPPEIIASVHREGRSGSVGGRLFVVTGSNGYGRPYETEVLIFRDKRSYRATHAVFWSGEKFPAGSARK